MKKIVIYGAGGFGREVQWLIERINDKKPTWEIIGYLDDGVKVGTEVNGHVVLGGLDALKEYDESLSITCAVGSANTRKKIIDSINQLGNYQFPNLIEPSVYICDSVLIGKGNIICAGNIFTVNINIKDFVIVNLSCTVGHDVEIDSFVTIYPGVNVSGCVNVGECVELGTGSKIIQGKRICTDVIVGAGAVVVNDINERGTYIGVPAKMK